MKNSLFKIIFLNKFFYPKSFYIKLVFLKRQVYIFFFIELTFTLNLSFQKINSIRTLKKKFIIIFYSTISKKIHYSRGKSLSDIYKPYYMNICYFIEEM